MQYETVTSVAVGRRMSRAAGGTERVRDASSLMTGGSTTVDRQSGAALAERQWRARMQTVMETSRRRRHADTDSTRRTVRYDGNVRRGSKPFTHSQVYSTFTEYFGDR